MKTIVVTGGAGFLGSNLCQRLLNDGNKVICIDNFYTGRMENIQQLLLDNNFALIRHDIEEKITIDDKIDEIFNLACPASPPHYQKSPTKTIKTNVIGMINMLELANKHRAKILQASTSEVYGDPIVHPQPESYRGNVNPIGIRACYDEGKRCAETLCFDYNREFGTQIKVIRIFNTYGPNMDPKDGRVVSNFILQALNNEDITIYGDGKQTRSFCYVDDLIEGMIRMMGSEDSFYGPVNIGNPVEFTMLELAEKVINLTNSKSKLIYFPLPADDPTQRKPIITLAKEKLKWNPKIQLDEGLDYMIYYFLHRQ
ncbi:MAG: UDP-glucuronic acid decarboxylase family protein [Clostridia bacterium]